MTNLTLVLLPGLHGTTGLFEPLKAVMPKNYEVLTIEYPCQETKTIDELVEKILAAIENLKAPFVIVAESFSGPISLKVADRQPEHLLGIILVATFLSRPSVGLLKYLPWEVGFRLVKPLYSIRASLSRSKKKELLMLMSSELSKVKPTVLAHRVKTAFEVDAEKEFIDCVFPLVYFRARYDVVVPYWCTKRILALRKIPVVSFDTPHFLLQISPENALVEIEKYTQEWLARVDT